MRILLDTSVLVAAMVEAHPAHEQGLAWLKRVTSEADKGLVAAHSLAELYAVLTTLPVHPPISPLDAQQLIKHNVIEKLEIVFLSDQDYIQVIEHLAALGIVGGATYDALILRAAAKAKVDLVVTFNERDFQRVCPNLADRIVAP
ncbi:type II toxin-antitoxin system VapC family toxin [Candidatus Parcubacteria bacterium]|nr:MAG: type II toxin-antitoxin system VapC family toxin [Candidatus Parcubacteria bacterium]